MSLIPEGDSLGRSIIIVDVVGATIAISAVALRLWARRIQKSLLNSADYTLLLALFLALSLVASTVLTVVWGLGQDITEVDPSKIQLLLKGMLTGQVLWISSNTCVRVSILLAYTKIFFVKPFRIVCYGTMVLNSAYWTAVMLQTFLICRPFAYNWNPLIPGGSCGNQKVANRSIGVINMVLDLLLVVLPIPMLWGLQMPRGKKIAIGTIFGMGFGICILTAVRVWQIEHMDVTNVTKSYAIVGLCAILEPLLGIANACLPFFGPIIQHKIPKGYAIIRQTFQKVTLSDRGGLDTVTTKGTRSGTGWRKDKQNDSAFSEQRIGDNDTYPLWKIENRIEKGNHIDDSVDSATCSESGIRVRHEWLVHEEGRGAL